MKITGVASLFAEPASIMSSAEWMKEMNDFLSVINEFRKELSFYSSGEIKEVAENVNSFLDMFEKEINNSGAGLPQCVDNLLIVYYLLSESLQYKERILAMDAEFEKVYKKRFSELKGILACFYENVIAPYKDESSYPDICNEFTSRTYYITISKPLYDRLFDVVKDFWEFIPIE